MAGLLSANDTYENRSPVSSPKQQNGWGSPSGAGRLSKLWGSKAGKVTSPSARSSSTIVPTRSQSALTLSPSLANNRASSGAKLGSITGFRQNAVAESPQQTGDDGREHAGLGFHLEDASTPPLFIKKRTQSATAAAVSTHTDVAENHTSIPAFPDFAIPDLADSVSAIDHQLLLSPFTLASPHFGLGLQASPEVRAPSSGAPSFIASSNQHGSASGDASVTPQTAPKQRFFQTGSSSASFARFPTPDKLALGFTPSPMTSPAELRITDKAASPQQLQVAGSAARISTVPLSSSNNTLASQISSDSSDSSPSCLDVAESQNEGALDRSNSRKSRHGRENEDIRASLLQFPSPPCSPRMFEGFAASMSEAMDSLRPTDILNVASPSLSSSGWGGATPALTHCDTSTEDTSEVLDDSRPSLDSVQLPYTNTPEKARRYTSQFTDAAVPFPSFFLPPLDIRGPARLEKPSVEDTLTPLQSVAPLTLRHKSSSPSLPPNEPLPALPAPVKVTAEQKPAIFGGSPVGKPFPTTGSTAFISQEASNALEVEIAADTFAIADAIVNGTPPPTPRARSREPSCASPLHQDIREHAPRSASQATTAASERLKESLQGSEGSRAEKADARKRRASLSIKIPRILSKLRRNQPSPALPITPLDGPGSRFSPESEAPPSPHVRPNFVKRLTRAVSSPNLRGTASVAGLPTAPSRDGSRFVTPASAPPVPTDFQHLLSAPIAPGPSCLSAVESAVESPLSTPALTADTGLTASSTPPLFKQPQSTSLPSEYTLQNPYFPEAISKAPSSQELLPNDESAIKRCRSPSSPEDMQWLEGQPCPIVKFAPEASASHNEPVEADKVRQTTSSSPADRGNASTPANSVHYAAAPSKATLGGSGTSSASTRSSASSTSDDEDDEDEDKHSRRSNVNSDDYDEYGASEEQEDEDSEDDDVPLATAHPDALKAQKSLKATMKERRGKKDTTKGSTSMRRAGTEPGPKEPSASAAVGRSSSARTASNVVKRPSPRKQNTVPAASQYNPFNFVQDDLSGKKTKGDPNASRGRSATLRSEAEPKRPDSTGDRPHTLLLPQTDEQVKRRNRSRGREDLAPPLAPFVQDSVLTMSEGSDDDDDVPLKIAGAGNRSTSNAQQHKPARNIPAPITKSNSVKSSEPARSITKSPPQPAASLPVAIAPSELASANRPTYHSKQRVYINDPQHHFMFDIDERTTPSTVLQHLRSKGMISTNPAWAVVEMWRTLGVERPMREYELLQDSIQSWGSDLNASLFLVKKTTLAPKLLSSSQVADNEGFGGWVQMEVKRGKWSKRWLEIRSQSIFVGKSEKARDQTMLCSLSSFDAYVVPQPCVAKLKAPKACAFGLKSVDKVSLFENAQDYIHYFSIKTEAERDSWVEKILDARSILVRQLLAAKATAPAHDTRTNIIAQPQQAASVSRSNSRHQSPPLPQGAVFAEGSLLARKPSSASMSRDNSLKSPTSLAPPPVPAIPSSALSNGSFAHIPQGREWEKLSPAERQRHILEAERKARTEGNLLELDKHSSSARNRSKSVSAAKQ